LNLFDAYMSKTKDLNTKQLRAIQGLLQEVSIKKAAKKAGVSRSSIRRWMEMPEFKTELDRRRLELFNEGLNLLKLSTKKAALKLLELLNSKDKTQSRWASKEILNFAIRAAEIQDIEQRLERLEDRLL